MARLGYATVGSNDLEAAKAFYNGLFDGSGIAPAFEHPSGGRVYEQGGAFCFGVVGPYDQQAASVGNGAMVAFVCDSAAEVDAMYARALALGGADEGAPGLRGPGFYFAYFRDRDGNKLCAYHLG